MYFASIKKIAKPFIVLCFLLMAVYGLGRLYYRVTGGFTISNITYDLPYDSRWDIPPLTLAEKKIVQSALGQKYNYLGKGCQSYVFESEDGKYVVKFFKYQRFRPQAWLDYLAFIPFVDEYRLKKIEKKKNKLESVFTSWKIAYEDLNPESGVVYVHLNKTRDLNKILRIKDKIGFEHKLNVDDYEFMIQRKAKMLCPTIDELMTQGNATEAKSLLSRLLELSMSEFYRGFADNDHALMQNTGVLEMEPIHIDVGQFIQNSRVKNPAVWRQELFNKTWKFRKWLEKYPELLAYLENQLKEIIGEEEFLKLKPQLNKAEVGIISHKPSF